MDHVAIDGGQFQAITSPKISFLDQGGGLSLWVFGVLVTLKVLGNETSVESYAAFEDFVPPGAGPPLHIHTKEDESWYLLEGELMWSVGGREFHAEKGSFVHLPRLVPHTFANRFDKPARMFVTYAPGGFERWFIDVGTRAAFVDGQVVPPRKQSVEERERGVKLMQDYGIVFPSTASKS